MKKRSMKQFIKKHKTLFAGGLAGCALLGSAVASAAFWTDKISLNQEVSSMTVGIKYDADTLKLDNSTPYLPGDSRNFTFKVVNTGDISVDIKPVIKLTASNDMVKGASEFIIADTAGNEITDYKKTYYDKDGAKVADSAISSGGKFRTVEYELSQEKTLAGSKQKESTKGENETEKQYSYALKMTENTGNDFKNTTASLDVSTYAIQHRNRTAGDDWISIAAGR